MRNYVILTTLSLLLFFAISCEHERITGLGPPELSNIQNKIFSPTCAAASCHVPGGAGPMALRTANESFQNLVNVSSSQVSSFQRVEPFDPANSYIIMKLRNDNRIQFERMPLGGNALSDAEIELIEDWISNGALSN